MQSPNHTPLIVLPAVILDLETTGLDVRNDRVIQIGIIGLMHSGSANNGNDELVLMDQLVNPGIPVPTASTEVHHIRNEDVADAPHIHEVAAVLCDIIKDKVVIGQHIAFDLAILRREFARNDIVWHEPASLDVSMLTGALQPALFDVSLESICTFLGVNITDRHTAVGDCLAALHCWKKLVPLLQEKNVRTLGEAVAFSATRDDLVLRQMESGWLETPAGLVVSRPAATQRIDSYIFKHHLADVMTTPAPVIAPETTLREAAREMVNRQTGCLCVGIPGQEAQGIVTEHDIMRLTAEGIQDMDSTPVKNVMSTPVIGINHKEILYRALARMDHQEVSYLCVIDDNGVPTGVVSQRNLLQYRARGSNMLYDAMQSADDAHALAETYSKVVHVVSQLVDEELNGFQIAQVISTELQALVHRATQLAVERMKSEGRGDAPARWSVLVLGSGGRTESLLGTDQDNALIHDGSSQDDEWFAQFGVYVNELLDTAGLPLCKGGVMISNAKWRGNIEEWNVRVSNWIQRANPEDLLNVDIFFDLVAVAGKRSYARELHKEAVTLASRSHAFMNLLAQSVRSVAPQFKLFGRIALEEGRIDLKRNGLLPLVSFARTVALRIGSTARTTPQRLRDVVETGRLSEGDAERLIALQKNLLGLIVKQQLADSNAGIPMGSKVDVRSLSKQEYNRLKHELHHLDTMVNEIQTFTTS